MSIYSVSLAASLLRLCFVLDPHHPPNVTDGSDHWESHFVYTISMGTTCMMVVLNLGNIKHFHKASLTGSQFDVLP